MSPENWDLTSQQMGRGKYVSETEADFQDGAKDPRYTNLKLFIDHCSIIYNKASNVQRDNRLVTTK